MKVVAEQHLIYLQQLIRDERRRPRSSRPGSSDGDLGQ